jgi:DNA-binding MarR family transcriptional regulator
MATPQRANTGTLMLYAYKNFEEDLFARMHAAGHEELRPKHGAVIANIERDGTRLTTLARRAGIGTPAMLQLVDEMERTGYVRRRPDPSDRRAKLVVPTARGIDAAHLSFRIIEEIEANYERLLGRKQYAQLQNALGKICEAERISED